MRLKAGLIGAKTGSGETLLDPGTGRFWRFNRTGAAILDLARSGLDRTGIADGLARRYGLSPADAARDIEAFVRDLERKGLLVDGQG
ncbi:PqqD family protein [Micromonospora cathayae]|uniref:PqqD family protein n=1 Tax=Micromonospora cathayae TaxID=3028804 RepID=A0ABY7ZNL6_9ACTN|nr:PqqD family protein [Micromonospora sp. HUAS 3]WDZ84591.1 PqqD family protein [Micromonospora sp. HUAS 3]